jgi:hypothetical protein
MRWLTAACVATVGITAVEDKPDGKRHEYRATESELHNAFRRGRDGKLWNQLPEAWIKANESIAIRYAIKPSDVELFECSSDNPDVRLGYQPNEKDVSVVIRSGDFRSGGVKGTARVMWRLYDVTGRQHHWKMTVNFE